MPAPLALLAAPAIASAAGELATQAPRIAQDIRQKAREAAQDFEAVFLHSMFETMFTGIGSEGPFGGGGSNGIWRSFLSEEYARSFAKAGGIGLADHVQNALLAAQEARSR